MGDALADPPDVVVLLRFAKREVRRNRCEAMGCDPLYLLGNSDGFEMIQAWIEDKFHVRLTDDGGWEWTDE